MQKHNLHHFDGWAATFGEPVTAMELSPDGAGYRLNTRFARFVNVPELMQIFRQTADVQTAQMLNLPRPKLEAEKPSFRNAPASPELKEFVESLAQRAEALRTGRVDPRVDNMLKITTEGRKAALDLRLMKPSLPDDPQSKVNLAVENIHRVWETTRDDRLTQLVFCDLSTPRDKGFSVYRDMADKLKRFGIPESEIAFIQDYDADNAKLALFRSVREGKVRVLFGSTQKMGSGTNVQKRLVALHHLDAPWRPADVEQREGRILRQGNRNSLVKIHRYVTEGSFDAYMWQTLETKAKFIAQVMSGDMTVRRLEDMDSAALTYAEVKAIASGNPLVIEKAQVDAELIRLNRLRSAHAEEQYRIRNSLRHAREESEKWTERLANLRDDLKVRQDTSGDQLRMQLDKQVLDNRGVAGELLLRRAEKSNRVLAKMSASVNSLASICSSALVSTIPPNWFCVAGTATASASPTRRWAPFVRLNPACRASRNAPRGWNPTLRIRKSARWNWRRRWARALKRRRDFIFLSNAKLKSKKNLISTRTKHQAKWRMLPIMIPRRSFRNNRPKRNQAGKTNEWRSMYEGKIHFLCRDCLPVST
ncbi:MAG TPA: hypothetical protein VFY06_03675 [Verrucomicrobiae bacterium]|nr:hypothetical protein [Verrucomicrobiae bacterium]